MNKFKRTISLLGVIIFAGMAVAGCALFERDIDYYNNLVVARVEGIEEPITKKQLMDAFNNYGYRYVSEYGKTLKEAYDMTLDTLIDIEIVAKNSVELFGGLTDYESGQVRKTSYESMEKSFREIEETVRKEKDWEVTSTGEDANASTTAAQDVYTPYEKYLIKEGYTMLDDGGKVVASYDYKINLAKYSESTSSEYIYKNNSEFIDYLSKPRGNSQIEKDITAEAKARLARYLRNNEKGTKQTDTSDDAVISRQLDKMQKSEAKNVLITRMQECFEQGIVDSAEYQKMLELRDGVNSGASTVSIPGFSAYEEYIATKNQTFVADLAEQAEQEYLYNVRDAIDRYSRGLDTLASYSTKLLGGLAGVYYVPKQAANQFFTVSHILVGYSEEQEAKLAEIEAQYKQDKNEANRENAIAKLRAEVTTYKHDENGVETGDPMTVNQVLAEVQRLVMPDATNRTPEAKANAFRDCIYMFNSDPGMVNPEFEYVIGADMRTDKSANSTETDSMSQMVPEFTAAARELFNYNYEEGRGGWEKVLERVTDANGKVSYEYDYVDLRGSMSGVVWTDYGAHIIMYTRNISDFIYTNTVDLIGQSYENYLHATQTSYGNKTTFDTIVEGLTKPSYNLYEQNILAVYKSENEVTYYKYNYKDLATNKG